MNRRERHYAVFTSVACIGSCVALALATGSPKLAGIAGTAVTALVETTKAVAGGLLGNLSDRGVCRAIRAISEKVLDTSRPLNHDLVRAVRGAQLQAVQTLLAEHERFELQGLHESGWDRSADIERAQWSRLAKELNAWCEREKSASIPPLDDATTKVLSERIDGLLKDPLDGDASLRIRALWNEALAALLVELQEAVGTLPASFVARLEDPDDGWRAVARLLFAESYKNDSKVFAVLVVELLGALQDQLEGLRHQSTEDHAALVALAEQHHEAIFTLLQQQCGALGARFIEALNQLRKDLDARPAHSELRLRVGDVRVKLDELLRQDQRFSQQVARQDRILRMLLMMAMREEANRRGQPIDGRFGIAAEDVSEIIRDKSSLLLGRSAALIDLDRWQATQAKGVRFVSAAAGIGKSSLLASWTLEREAVGQRVVRHFFSRNFPETIATESALEHLLRQLRCQLGHGAEPASDDIKSVKDRIHRLLQQMTHDPPLIVVLDGLDEADAESLPAFLPNELGKGVYVVIGVRQLDPGHPPQILRNWCQRAQKDWLRLGSTDAEWTRVHLPPIDEAAIDEWLALALPTLTSPARSHLLKPLIRASEGVPLFARFLIEELKQQQLHALDLSVAPSFRTFAERELQAFVDVGQPVHPVFALMALARAPISELEISRVLGQRVEIPSALTRWFLITGDRRDPKFAFAHPRLARVFADVISRIDRDAAEECLIRHLANWSTPGNDYALRHGLVHFTESPSLDVCIKLIRSIGFHTQRLERFPDWDSLGEALALAQRLPLTIEDRRWVAGLAQIKPTLTGFRPEDRAAQLRALAADFLGEAEIKGRSLTLAHSQRSTSSHLRTVLTGHTGGILGALLLNAGQMISWSWDGTLRKWELATGTSTEWRGHESRVSGAFRLNGDHVLSWSWDGTLRLWDIATGHSTEWSGRNTGWISGALQLGASSVLTWSLNGCLHLWDIATGESTEWRGHTSMVIAALLLDSDRVLSWSNDGTLRVWEIATGNSTVWLGHTDTVLGVMRLDINHVLSWSSDDTMRLWEIAKGDSTEWNSHSTNGSLPLDSNCAVSWGKNFSMRMWDIATGASTEWLGHTDAVGGAMRLDRDRVLSWSSDGTLRVWDIATGNSTEWRGHTGAVLGALLLSFGRVLSWSSDGTLRVWDVKAGNSTERRGHTTSIMGALQLDENQIVSWSLDCTLRVWDIAAADLNKWLDHANDVIGALALDADHLLSWSWDHTLRKWDIATGASVEWRGHTAAVLGAVSLNATTVLSWSSDGTLRTWDIATGASIGLRGHTNPVLGTLKLDSGRALSWSNDGSLLLWNVATGDSAEWRGHSDCVSGAIRLDFHQVLSWSLDGSLRLWNIVKGSSVEWRGHESAVIGVLPLDAGHLLSWSEDRTIRVWNIATGESTEWIGHKNAVKGALRLDPERVMSWDITGTLRVWVIATGVSTEWCGHTDTVLGALLLSTSRALTWSSDGTIREWELATGNSVAWRGHGAAVRGVLATKSGHVLSWNQSGSLSIWDPSGQALDTFAQPFGLIEQVVEMSSSALVAIAGTRVLILRVETIVSESGNP